MAPRVAKMLPKSTCFGLKFWRSRALTLSDRRRVKSSQFAEIRLGICSLSKSKTHFWAQSGSASVTPSVDCDCPFPA